MSGHLQAGLAVAVAVALHIGLFALQPEPAGAVSSGAGGADLVSLQAADAVLADLVADYGAEGLTTKAVADLYNEAHPKEKAKSPDTIGRRPLISTRLRLEPRPRRLMFD